MQTDDFSPGETGAGENAPPVADIPADAALPRAGVFGHPGELLADPALSVAEKRMILASWASDRRAVENAPALRRIDSGAIISIDDILDAIDTLDETERRREARLGARMAFARRPGAPGAGLGRRRFFVRDDDDPPLPPARAARAFHPIFTEARAKSA